MLCQDVLELISSYLDPLTFYKLNKILKARKKIYWKYYYEHNKEYPNIYNIIEYIQLNQTELVKDLYYFNKNEKYNILGWSIACNNKSLIKFFTQKIKCTVNNYWINKLIKDSNIELLKFIIKYRQNKFLPVEFIKNSTDKILKILIKNECFRKNDILEEIIFEKHFKRPVINYKKALNLLNKYKNYKLFLKTVI